MRISDWSSDVCSSDLLDTASARGWNLCGKPERFVEIDRVDQIKPRKLFLGFRKRAVGNLGAAIAHAHRGGGVYGLQRLRGKALPAGANRGVVGQTFAVGNRMRQRFVEVDQTQEFHGCLP